MPLYTFYPSTPDIPALTCPALPTPRRSPGRRSGAGGELNLDQDHRVATVREQRGMRAGGYGVLLARNLVDELLYNEKGNEVLLIKYLSSSEN